MVNIVIMTILACASSKSNLVYNLYSENTFALLSLLRHHRLPLYFVTSFHP